MPKAKSKESKSTMVSVRIPSSLIDELRLISKKDHFLDVSETVRSIIRSNWLRYKDPVAYQLKEIKKEISDSLTKKNQEMLLAELEKIRDSLLGNKDEKK